MKGDLTFNEEIEEISIFYFLLSIIFYTGGVLSSLSSYALDLPLFICGSLTFHLIIMSLFDNNKIIYFIPIFWLSFFSPIIKLTGIVTPIFSLSFILISHLNEVIKKSNYSSNFGLFKNIIGGLDTIFRKYDKAIILEDDLLVEKNFLKYMNQALNLYSNDFNVACISGWFCSHNYKNISKTFFLKEMRKVCSSCV